MFVSGAVRRNKLLRKPSNADIEDCVKLWLRQSCDGNGGRRAREAGGASRRNKKFDRHPVLSHSETDIEPSD